MCIKQFEYTFRIIILTMFVLMKITYCITYKSSTHHSNNLPMAHLGIFRIILMNELVIQKNYF